jgi:hypothetical protein
MSAEVKFIRGNDRIRALAGRTDIADDVAQIRAAMAEADRAYAMRLAAEFTKRSLVRADVPAAFQPVLGTVRAARGVLQVRRPG